MMKIAVKSARVEQLSRFYREGSILGGTAKSGSLGVEVVVELESDEPPARIADLIRAAQGSCYTHGSLTGPVAVETHVRLNGRPLSP